MKHFILGTAGHVDHGKSSLIEALTSINTDRLPEEKERGLSIDLGFAPLQVSDPDEKADDIHLGVVDVPGHHRFLRNMIAGVGGFDAALLVVDCCEGVKPQTSEHLKILELLQTRLGLVVLSKADKTDEDSLEIARWELEELLQGTFLEGAPIVATSAHTGLGLDELKAELYRLFSKAEERNPQGVARLPIDRAFTKQGFGAVVTGSLWSGLLQVGDEVEILPMGLKGKVRGIQTHGQSSQKAGPGQRVAVNVSGLEKGDLKRGHTLVSPPGAFEVGERFAVGLQLLTPEPKLLKRKFRGTFFQGTSHHQVAIYMVAESEKSQETYAQIQFSEPVLLCKGDHFLLRDETDQRLLAGGLVLSREEKPFRRSKAKESLQRYQALAGGGEVGRALSILKEQGGFCKESVLKKQLGLSQVEWDEQFVLLLDSGKVLKAGKDRLWEADKVNELSQKITALLTQLTEAARWKSGWTPSEISSLLGLKSGKGAGLDDVLDLLVQEQVLKRLGPLYSPLRHEASLGKKAKGMADRILELLNGDGFSPRDWQICLAETARDDKKLRQQLEEYLLGTQKVLKLSDKLCFTPEILEKARTEFEERGSDGFTASEARQILDTSRKFIIPILEWMDNQGWTLRVDDKRKMAPR